MKGQVAIIEVIIAAISLLIAFNMIITSGEYQTKWKDSLNSLYGRDIMTTVDRLGKLHDYAFDQDIFNIYFRSRIDAVKDSIVKIDTQETIKNVVYASCSCTIEQRDYIQNVLSNIKFNERVVSVNVCTIRLPDVICPSTQQYPDILIIWGQKDLTSHVTVLNDLKNNGVGIIEIADMQQSDVNAAQQNIFGLQWLTTSSFPLILQDEILIPRNTSVITYQSYKWFYHLPYLLDAPTSLASIPVDNPPFTSPPSCATTKEGVFKSQDDSYKFWICDGTSVYFDTNRNNNADIGPMIKGQEFSIGSSNFKLNYIDSIDKIRLSFKPSYKFNDFLVTDETHNKLFPIDNDKNKILLSAGFWDTTKEIPIAAVILSGTENAKTAWVADFSRRGLANTGDDHKQLLASLIFSMSNKNEEKSQQLGQITSYINVNNADILEIYKVELSVATPF